MREEKKKHDTIRTSMILIAVVLLLFIPTLVHLITDRRIETQLIKFGTIEDAENADAVIVRDEEPQVSGFGGSCASEVGEGEKVSAGVKIGSVANETTAKLRSDLLETDRKLLQALRAARGSNDTFSGDEVRIDNEIGDKLAWMIEDCNRGSFYVVTQTKREIDRLIRKKAEILEAFSASSPAIIALRSERERLQNELTANSRDISAGASGIISFAVDGYEDILKPGLISGLTPEAIEAVKAVRMETYPENLMIQPGKPYAKIEKGLYCYLVFSVKEDVADSFKAGYNTSVRLNEINREISAKIDSVSGKINGKCVISLKIDKYINALSNMRRINIDVIRNAFEGYIIPIQSLKEYDRVNQRAKVMLVNANYADECEVSVLGENKDYAVIGAIDGQKGSNIGLNSIFVVHPENIKEGQVVNQ